MRLSDVKLARWSMDVLYQLSGSKGATGSNFRRVLSDELLSRDITGLRQASYRYAPAIYNDVLQIWWFFPTTVQAEGTSFCSLKAVVP